MPLEQIYIYTITGTDALDFVTLYYNLNAVSIFDLLNTDVPNLM